MAARRFQARNVVFTSYAAICDVDRSQCTYGVWQKEVCPETKREHWQGYLEFPGTYGRKRILTIIGDADAHIEPRRGTAKQASDYCKKPETSVPDTQVEFGELSNQGKRSDLAEVMDRVRNGASDSDLLDLDPATWARNYRAIREARKVLIKPPSWRTVSVSVLWGATGTGKTRYVYATWDVSDVFKLDRGNNSAVWFDGYVDQKVLLIDDYYGWIEYGRLLNILDGHPYTCQVKGSSVLANWTTVVITSNRPPKDWYKNILLTPALRRRLNFCIYFHEDGRQFVDTWELPLSVPDVSSSSSSSSSSSDPPSPVSRVVNRYGSPLPDHPNNLHLRGLADPFSTRRNMIDNDYVYFPAPHQLD